MASADDTKLGTPDLQNLLVNDGFVSSAVQIRVQRRVGRSSGSWDSKQISGDFVDSSGSSRNDLWRSSELVGYSLSARDGSVGRVKDFLFDDTDWTLRWVRVDTGTWLSSRPVLIPASALGPPDSANEHIPVDLTRERVENSPDVDADAPVSRQIEADIYAFYGWTPYWAAGFPLRGASDPSAAAEVDPIPEPAGDPHLRSIREITGYYVNATDGDIGHVDDFLFDPAAWSVRYLVIDTKNWWPGRKVLISPQWIKEIKWMTQHIYVDHARAEIRSSPEYDSSMSPTRDYEDKLFGHYGRSPYWL